MSEAKTDSGAAAGGGADAGSSVAAAIDAGTRRTLERIPLMTVRAGPRSGVDEWKKRLKEEYTALIKVRCRVRPLPRPGAHAGAASSTCS